MSTELTSTPGLPQAVGASDQPIERGRLIGEYEVEEMIGKGGFGTVYRAQHPVIGKLVAIKVLARRYAADEEIVSRFVSEARAVNQIRHRNIIDIFSFGQLDDGRHYYVMEHLDGEPLDRCLARRGALPLDEALPILRGLALALDAAHGKGIAHRDLKPENIFIASGPDGDSFPKLLDFGIAKLMAPEEDVRHRTNTGVPIGTPYFMSPEQCRGRDVDSRTDIYSFGVMTYCVLTGVRPFERADYMELMLAHMNEEPPPPSSIVRTLPVSVDLAIAWMMKKDRDQRPPTVADAVAALDPDNPLGRSAQRLHRPSFAPLGAPSVSALAATTPSAHLGLAATTPSIPTATVTAPAWPRRRIWIAVAVIVLAIGGTVGWIATRGTREGAEPVARPAPAPPPTPAPPAPAPPASTVVAPSTSLPEQVTASPHDPVRVKPIAKAKVAAHPARVKPAVVQPADSGAHDSGAIIHLNFGSGSAR
jgi:serine/threonine-protein kinase